MPTSSTVSPCFVPVNVNENAERDLFYAQRVICGWKAATVDKMFNEVRLGHRMLYWVCIPATADLYLSDSGKTAITDTNMIKDTKDTKDAKDSIHIPLLPVQSQHGIGPLSNETLDPNPATKSDLTSSKAVQTNGYTGLLPVGHISVDNRDTDFNPTPLLGNSDGRVLSITTLFILPHHRKLGLARWSMLECERRIRAGIAFVQPADDGPSPYQSCEKIALSCLSERHHVPAGPGGVEFWNRQGLEFGVRANGARPHYLGDWYRSLGYVRTHEMEKFHEENRFGKEFYWWAEIWELELK